MDWGVLQKDFLVCRGIHIAPWSWRLCCPANVTSTTGCEIPGDGEQDEVDEVLLEAWEARDTRTLAVIGISGICQLIVSWCCCPGE